MFISVSGMSSLKELDLSRCVKITDAGIKHVVSISHLEKLHLSRTGVTADGIMELSKLLNLSTLDLGGLPVSDAALCSLTVCFSTFLSPNLTTVPESGQTLCVLSYCQDLLLS